jgi:hypothetical protein
MSGNQTHLGIRAKVNVRRRFVTAQDAKGAPTASRHKRSTQRHELPLALTQPSSLYGVRVGRWIAIRGNQMQSEAIRGNQRRSEATRGNQWKLVEVSGNQRQSDVPTEQRRPLGSDWIRSKRPREVSTLHAAASAAASDAAVAAAVAAASTAADDDGARSVSGIDESN